MKKNRYTFLEWVFDGVGFGAVGDAVFAERQCANCLFGSVAIGLGAGALYSVSWCIEMVRLAVALAGSGACPSAIAQTKSRLIAPAQKAALTVN